MKRSERQFVDASRRPMHLQESLHTIYGWNTHMLYIQFDSVYYTQSKPINLN